MSPDDMAAEIRDAWLAELADRDRMAHAAGLGAAADGAASGLAGARSEVARLAGLWDEAVREEALARKRVADAEAYMNRCRDRHEHSSRAGTAKEQGDARDALERAERTVRERSLTLGLANQERLRLDHAKAAAEDLAGDLESIAAEAQESAEHPGRVPLSEATIDQAAQQLLMQRQVWELDERELHLIELTLRDLLFNELARARRELIMRQAHDTAGVV